MAPFSKTGGLADVTGSLPLALAKLGLEILIVTPRYRGLTSQAGQIKKNVRVRFVQHEGYFNRSGLYGNEAGDYGDNLERFVYFNRQALEEARQEGFKPDLVHVHDWQTSLMPVYLKTVLKHDPFFENVKSVLTIHNLGYQGQFAHKLYPQLGLADEYFNADGFEFYGRINLLKAGLLFADGLTTVSPSYAKEIQTDEFGFGLDGVVCRRREYLRGILNGIDTDIWNPQTDKYLTATYSADRIDGKALCKKDLQKHFGLEEDPARPLFIIVSRLAEQKGWEIFSEIADKFLEKPVQLAILGDGDAVYKTQFQNIHNRHPKNTALQIGFDSVLAHQMYAGGDFFLMPSYFEPCGLGQMISLNYGTLPIVRKTGGLADTVWDSRENEARCNGFVFESRRPEDLMKAVERALGVFEDKKALRKYQRRGMETDFSWDQSARDYQRFYGEIVTQKRAA